MSLGFAVIESLRFAVICRKRKSIWGKAKMVGGRTRLILDESYDIY